MPKNKKKKPPFDLVAPLKRKPFKRELKQATRREFGPLTRQLQSEQAASANRANAEIPAWFAGYQNDLARIMGDSAAAYNQANQSVQDFSNQGAQQDAANRGEIMNRMSKDAALRGTSVDPGVDIGGANAEAARRNVQTSALGNIANQGANRYAYLAGQQANAGLAGIEARQSEAARGQKINADQRELAQKKGDFQYEFGRDARESERKFYLENQALKGQNYRANLSARTSAQNSKRSSRTSAQNSRRSSRTSRQNSKRTQREQNQRQEDAQKHDSQQAKADAKRDKRK